MPDMKNMPERRNSSYSINSTNSTLVDTLCERASSMPQPQISNLLREFLKSMGNATASGESMTQAAACAKASEMAWNWRMSANLVLGDEILRWNLQYVNILMGCDDLASVTFPPSGLEDLIPPKTNITPSKTMAELFSKVALLYLRKRGPESLQVARTYLHLALDIFVTTQSYDENSLLPIAQDLNDVLELQGTLGLASEHFSRKSNLPQWVTDGLKKRGMSIAKQWCDSKDFDKDQFYEAKEAHELSPLAVATIEEHREAFTAMLRFTARTVTPHRMTSIASKLLLLAADTCNWEFAKDLLDVGAKASILDEHRRSSLHRLVLCRTYGDLGGFRMIKMLLDKDPSILDIEDENGKTALMLACEAEYPLKIKELLKYGANPNKKDSHLCSPFFIACSRGNDKIIQIFLTNDKTDPHKGILEINAPGPRRKSPLIAAVRFAARRNSKDDRALNSIKLLKQHDADPNQKDCEGLSALDYAKLFRKSQIKRILKPKKISSMISLISSSRIDHVSPLHSSNGHTEGGGSSTEKQLITAGPVEHDEQPEALQPKVSMREMTQPQVSSENVGPTFPDVSVDSVETDTDVAEPSHQGVLETLSPPSRKGKGKNIENENIDIPENAAIVSLQSSDPEIIEDGTILQQYSNGDDAAGIQEEEASDDFDDLSSWEWDGDNEDLSGSENVTHPVESSPHRGASEPRQCPPQNTHHDYNGPNGIKHSFNASLNHGISPSGSGSTNANNFRREGTQTAGGDPSHPEGEPEGESNEGKFACPYCKVYPLLFPQCIGETFDRISRLKQHLTRRHYEQFYCSICQETFNTSDLRDRHISSRRCQLREADIYVRLRLTDEQKATLSRCPPGLRGKVVGQWNFIFAELFPNRTEPKTPWADPAPSVYSTLRQEFRKGLTEDFVAQIDKAEATDVASIVGNLFDNFLISNLSEQQSHVQNPASAPAQQVTSFPAETQSPAYNLGYASQMQGNQQGATYTQAPLGLQGPPSHGSMPANTTPRFPHRPHPTPSHPQQPPPTAYLNALNPFPGVPFPGIPAAVPYHYPTQYHYPLYNYNDTNPQAIPAGQLYPQTQQDLTVTFPPAQSSRASENIFTPKIGTGVYPSNSHVVPASSLGALNHMMYNQGQYGVLPPQGWQIRSSPMHRSNEGLRNDSQGVFQEGHGSPTSGQHNLDTDMYSGGGGMAM